MFGARAIKRRRDKEAELKVLISNTNMKICKYENMQICKYANPKNHYFPTKIVLVHKYIQKLYSRRQILILSMYIYIETRTNTYINTSNSNFVSVIASTGSHIRVF